jgi:hypothetical protein
MAKATGIRAALCDFLGAFAPWQLAATFGALECRRLSVTQAPARLQSHRNSRLESQLSSAVFPCRARQL